LSSIPIVEELDEAPEISRHLREVEAHGKKATKHEGVGADLVSPAHQINGRSYR
jgi:hypothetical protein